MIELQACHRVFAPSRRDQDRERLLLVCMDFSIGLSFVIFGLLVGSFVLLERTQERPLFHPKQTSSWSHLQRAHPLPADTLFSVHDHGRLAALELGGRSPFTLP